MCFIWMKIKDKRKLGSIGKISLKIIVLKIIIGSILMLIIVVIPISMILLCQKKVIIKKKLKICWFNQSHLA